MAMMIAKRMTTEKAKNTIDSLGLKNRKKKTMPRISMIATLDLQVLVA